MPKIIQFLHTYQEARPLNGNDPIIPWNNYDTHRRKFLLSKGKYINNQTELEGKELSFWGEWEAQSEITPIIKASANPPNYFNIPFIDPSVPERTHTTDPYVFGNNFKYFICRQKANNNILKNLEPNSIILFGSSIDLKFCLDTVFVVSNNIKKYSFKTIDQVFPINKRGTFYHASINPLYGQTDFNSNVDADDNCRINEVDVYKYYEGVNFTERKIYHDLFSFVPSKIYDKENPLRSLFRQPEIKLDFINGGQAQGINSKEVSIEEIKVYFKEIIKQVEAQELLLGTHFKTPGRRITNLR